MVAINGSDGAATYGRLLALRDQAGQSLYERLTLANKLLSDHAWVESPQGGGGDESVAIDRLETNCFGDLCGALSLPDMLEILAKIPSKTTWKENKFNLRKMHVEMKAREKARTAPRQVSPSTNIPKTPEVQVKELRTELRSRDTQIADLKRENHKLRLAVKNLQAALAALQVEA